MVVGYFECDDFRLGTKTVRSFSALMIFLVGGCRPLRTVLITVLSMPVFFAHAAWLPARSTSERSKQVTSLRSRKCIYSHPPQLAASRFIRCGRSSVLENLFLRLLPSRQALH
jgi:hypothetical protein